MNAEGLEANIKGLGTVSQLELVEELGVFRVTFITGTPPAQPVIVEIVRGGKLVAGMHLSVLGNRFARPRERISVSTLGFKMTRL